ncbi:MAG: dockerin type I domain-containing protein [Clostridia bacterium]|nr:dockerin type I domain-containing protein [Clostridia bacterium]
MQGKNKFKFNKKILCILILFILVYTTIGFYKKTENKSYGATYTYNKTSNNLPSNFDTLYPGYKVLINTLVNNHPNWTFKLYETGLEWDAVINSEYQGHGSSPKNLAPSEYSSGWFCMLDTCKDKLDYDTSGRWRCASREAIMYTMDPRNTLNESTVFEYLQLSNDRNITKEQVDTMARQISYLNNQALIDAIYEVANDPNYNINPFYIIGKILQEQGSGASALCSGQGYRGQYIGYYNLFNVGASGNGTEAVILNGLAYAQSKGWDTPQKAIIGGIGTIKRYISRGQDTLYFQKFNVVASPYYSNQYAQNVLDAQSIGTILKGYYKNANLLDSSFTFIIPLYYNMPATACSTPTTSSGEVGELAYVNASGGLALRDAPNGNTMTYVNEGTQILILERATSKTGSYYWDKVSTPQGTGYMARESSDGSKTYLVLVNWIDNSTNNNYSSPDSNNIVITEPNTTVDKLKETYINSVIINKDGTEIFGDTLVGTGAKIKINGAEKYTIVKLGDVSGDGKISPSDYVKVKNKIMGVTSMDAITEKAADVNKDGSISPADYVKIKNHIMKTSIISI